MKKLFNLFLTLLLSGLFLQGSFAQSKVNFPNGQKLFVNGMNLPWVSFGYDLGPGGTNLTEIEARFKEIHDNGGNTVRFWVHCDGQNSPAFDANGTVVGAGTGMGDDLKAVCDLATKHNITIMFCLWSFDMLKNGQGTSATRARNYALLTNDTKMDAYMNTALTEMVTAVKGHKAILAWEIFNEPEAMTNDGQPWKDSGFEYYVYMSNIARFVNKAAGKIKSIDPSARVTNGTKSLMTNTDTQVPDDWGFSEKNWYSNSNLVAAGGQSNGTLDFYTIHFYSWMTTKYSPFDNNCSYWNLDKPLVVAEFWMDCFNGTCGNTLYTSLYDKGYAGAMGWTDDSRNMRPAICSAMKNIQSLHPADVNIIDGTIPVTGVTIVPTSISVAQYASYQLTATVAPTNATNKSVIWTSSNTAVATVNASGLVSGVAPGSATITVKTVDGGFTDACTVTVTSSGTNVALNKPVTVSSTEGNYGNVASRAVDGNTTTRWSSVYSDPQWIYVDLQSTYNITKVVLNWEAASAKDYRIEVSNDANTWNSIVTKSAMPNGARVDNISISGSGRYVRMYGTARTTQWGYSLFEFEVYGTAGVVPVTGVSLSPTSVTLTAAGQTQQLTATVIPSNATNKNVSYSSSNTAVATVNSSGIVTAVANGTATITVTTQDGAKTASSAITVNIPSNTTVTYQAENASLTGTYVATSISGYSGTGYVDGFDNTGDKVSFTVTAATAGNYALVARYASPYDNKLNYLYVNGSNLGEKSFPLSSGFTEVSLGNITLRAGANTIEIVKSWGYFMLDYIKVTGASGLKSAPMVYGPSITDETISVYPNPSNGIFNLKLNQDLQGAQVVIYDQTGKMIYKITDAQMIENIDISAQLKGLGFLKIEKEGQVITQKLMVK